MLVLVTYSLSKSLEVIDNIHLCNNTQVHVIYRNLSEFAWDIILSDSFSKFNRLRSLNRIRLVRLARECLMLDRLKVFVKIVCMHLK